MKKLLFVLAITCAASVEVPVSAGEKCAIPKDWGRLVVVYQPQIINLGNLVFEAEDGTLRMVPYDCKMPAKPVWEVRRLP